MTLALKLALAPLLVVQAMATRRRALVLPEANGALAHVRKLRDACDRDGNLPRHRHAELGVLVGMLESRLA